MRVCGGSEEDDQRHAMTMEVEQDGSHDVI